MREETRKTTGQRRLQIPRRVFLKGAAIATGMAAMGGIPEIVRAAQAPAYPKGTRLHLLQWLNMVTVADKLFMEQAAEFGKQMGVEVQIERIGVNDIRIRTAAAIEAKSGPDIIVLWNNFPHLFADGLADVSDIAEAIANQQGGYYDLYRANAYVGDRWLAVPYFSVPGVMNYREDWLREAGYTKFPDTWEELRDVGKKLKAMGHPVGQAFGHSEADPNTYCYSLMWSYGGMEVEKDGKTVALDKGRTLDAIKLNTAMWKDCFDEGGLSWDDSSNNRAFLAGSISITSNGASIYVVGKEKFPEVAKAMNHAPHPKGPAGRFHNVALQNSMLMKYSKNQKLAKEFIRWYMDKKQYEPWFITMAGFGAMPTKFWYDHPIWTQDPKLTPFRDAILSARHVGYAGQCNVKASEALAKYVIVDMFAKAIQGTAPEESLKWATGELKKIYSA